MVKGSTLVATILVVLLVLVLGSYGTNGRKQPKIMKRAPKPMAPLIALFVTALRDSSSNRIIAYPPTHQQTI